MCMCVFICRPSLDWQDCQQNLQLKFGLMGLEDRHHQKCETGKQ